MLETRKCSQIFNCKNKFQFLRIQNKAWKLGDARKEQEINQTSGNYDFPFLLTFLT